MYKIFIYLTFHLLRRRSRLHSMDVGFQQVYNYRKKKLFSFRPR